LLLSVPHGLSHNFVHLIRRIAHGTQDWIGRVCGAGSCSSWLRHRHLGKLTAKESDGLGEGIFLGGEMPAMDFRPYETL
jgi:hypothetical protein